ncbi:MAG: hypothetical protein IPL99_23425 [Candidatus Competibacteraceae bacterium]|nr:hypothetical protein [Candidatus Competibacteraceae bacterium]
MKYMLYERLFSEMQRFRESGYEYCFGSEVPYTGANGNPFRMRFNGGDLAYGAPGSINCCTSILAAFYKESERLSGRDFATCPPNECLPFNVSNYFAINSTTATDYRKAGAFPLSRTPIDILIHDGDEYVCSDFRNMRRGDFVQIWWYGEDYPPQPIGQPQRRFFGHSVFIHDVLVDESGDVWFQLLSAQRVNDTAGVGVAGTGEAAYNATDQQIQARLYSIGRWYRYREGDTSDDYKIIPEMYVGRFKRPFPCWPCFLYDDRVAPSLGRIPLPRSLLGNDSEQEVMHVGDFTFLTPGHYNNNAEDTNSEGGGFYPIGLNRTWHGGIHLRPPKSTIQAVHAISDGVIVAARCLADDTELTQAMAEKKLFVEGSTVLPSRNFVLIRHQVKISGSDKIFYLLYMHLSGKWEPIQLPDKQNDEPDELDPVDLLDPSTPFPSPHYQLFERQIFPRWLWQSHQEPKKLTCGYRNVGKGLDAGDTVLLAYPVAAGEVIGFTEGEYIHIEIFSKEDISGGDYPEKNSIVNKDHTKCLNSMSVLQDLRIKVENFCRINNTLLNLGVVSSNVLLQGEIARFFIHGDEIDRKSLRGLVLCHTSEWSDQIEWVKFQNTEAWGYYDDAAANKLKEITKLYAWMTKDIAKHCGLPEDHILYHYHSIQFIEWLAQKVKKGEAEQLIQDTTPFLENAGKRFDVNGKMRPPQWIVNTKKAQSLALFSEPAIGSVIMPFQKETGPWEQLDEHTDDKGNKYIKVSADPARWICVKSGGEDYVKEKY